MTFEEALAVTIEAKKKWGGGSSEAWLINAMAALGVLKLDEPPKSLPQKLRDFIMDARLVQGGAMERLGNLHDVLKDCGLKIAEDFPSPQESASE